MSDMPGVLELLSQTSITIFVPLSVLVKLGAAGGPCISSCGGNSSGVIANGQLGLAIGVSANAAATPV